MARYGGTLKDFPEYDPDAWKTSFENDRQTLALKKLVKAGKVASFAVADGYAHYYIQSKRPLVLLHIPFADAYRIPDAHLRGLRLEDVERARQRNWN